MTFTRTLDALIVGGGVAGLWTLNQLASKGYDCLLVEQDKLGQGQTIMSQGILHGGVKYAFGIHVKPDFLKELNAMPERWRQHLSGERKPDLRETKVLSDSFYLWASQGQDLGTYATRFTLWALSRLQLLQVSPYSTTDFPAWLQASAVYKMNEPVLDTKSLLSSLAKPHASSIVYGSCVRQDHGVVTVEEKISKETFPVQPKCILLTAGHGNQALAQLMGIGEQLAQERPLRQVLARGNLPLFYGHCMDNAAVTGKPSMTITSHYDLSGHVVWNIGGTLAENTDEPLQQRAERLFRKTLPGLDLGRVTWSTYHAIRSEPKTKDGHIPETATIRKYGNVFVCWPTKLVLAPLLADRIEQEVSQMGIQPSGRCLVRSEAIDIARAPWE
ncbi:FAD-dependent oxidoreductase [Candidatus Woesearchaeota archaeon]|nr:FAD-dependent oxidoreductase [Candidatus Woesearchaeota archaeon]